MDCISCSGRSNRMDHEQSYRCHGSPSCWSIKLCATHVSWCLSRPNPAAFQAWALTCHDSIVILRQSGQTIRWNSTKGQTPRRSTFRSTNATVALCKINSNDSLRLLYTLSWLECSFVAGTKRSLFVSKLTSLYYRFFVIPRWIFKERIVFHGKMYLKWSNEK